MARGIQSAEPRATARSADLAQEPRATARSADPAQEPLGTLFSRTLNPRHCQSANSAFHEADVGSVRKRYDANDNQVEKS